MVRQHGLWPTDDGTRWAVAVSGGGDSVALLHMLLKDGYGPRLVVLHYNHKWSDWGDTAEAFVRGLCARHNLELVVGQGRGRAATNAEEAARKARYAFFAREVERRQLAGVLLGHTQTDDVEGFLMRLARGSAVKGLSGIAADAVMNVMPAKAGAGATRRPPTPIQGETTLRLVRPLLGHTRADLRAYLKRHRQRYLNDPSNSGSDTFRARIRKLLPQMEKAGLHPQHIAASMASLRDADAALDTTVQALWRQHGRPKPQGAAYPRLALLALPEEIQLRLAAVLLRESNQPEPLPRRRQLAAMLQAVRQKPHGKVSLGRCLVRWNETDVDIGMPAGKAG